MSEESSDKESKGGLIERFVPILLLFSLVLAFAIGILWQKVTNLEKKAKTTEQPAATAQGQKAKISLDTIKGLFDKDVVRIGDSGSKLIIVEVSDPSCPYCGIASGKNMELIREIAASPNGARFKLVADGGTYVPPVPELAKLVNSGEASYIYLYMPGHGNGEMGAKALYCANDQGKYWEANDLLMSNAGYNLLNNDIKNDKTKSDKVANFLKKVVDAGKLKACLDNGDHDARLNSDTQLASSLGVTGTPGFFLNTTPFYGAFSYTDMKSVVEEALNN